VANLLAFSVGVEIGQPGLTVILIGMSYWRRTAVLRHAYTANVAMMSAGFIPGTGMQLTGYFHPKRQHEDIQHVTKQRYQRMNCPLQTAAPPDLLALVILVADR
jgi:hypothetical protein